MKFLYAKLLVAMVLIIAAISFCTACSSGKSSKNDSDTLISTDVSAHIAEPEFPDTAYVSVENVKYTIEIADSISGVLTSAEDLYANAPGVFTFRKGEHRDANFGGTIDTIPSDLHVDWVFTTREDFTQTSHGEWGGGTGWTGQPLYVAWPDTILSRFKKTGLNPSKEEIIVGSLSGDVYFIDYTSGQPSRPAINTGNPIKGTVSLDPTLNGNLYVGQGITSTQPVRALVIDLYKHRITHEVGPDPKAPRRWHAYDSSPIRIGEYLFRPGENGILYKYTVLSGSLRLHSTMRYYVNGAAPGIESSMAVSRNYGYIADNAGNVICVNLNTLKPVWHYKLPDDVDSTPVVCVEKGHPYVYVGSEVEHVGVTKAHYVKLDGLTGECIWLNETPSQRAEVAEKHFDGGYYASALPGSGNCKDLIFINVVNNNHGQNGSFIALERATGKTRYSVNLKRYAWSSPVGFLTKNGVFIVVTFDCIGYGYIINGINGEIISCKRIGANFESSPVVIGHTLVIGSRGSKIYRLSLM